MSVFLVFLLLAGVLCDQEYPSDVLDLKPWKITTPEQSIGSFVAREVVDLDGYYNNLFFVDSNGAAVFRAPAGGATTSGSEYPRCELREMVYENETKTEAEWSISSSVHHILTGEFSIDVLPKNKSQVVCAQIHDSSDDVIMIRLEDTKLFIEKDGDEAFLFTDEYALGTKFGLKIDAGDGEIAVTLSYNGTDKVGTISSTATGCYFKAGCYTQSNLEYDKPFSYGQVSIYSLSLSTEESEDQSSSSVGTFVAVAAGVAVVGAGIFFGIRFYTRR